MRDLRETVDKTESLLKEAGAEKYAFEVTESEKRELNTEMGDFTLFRTIYDAAVSVTVFADGRKGSAGGSDLTDEGLKKAVDDALAAAESAEQDPANDIAPDQGTKTIEQGPQSPDMERFYQRLSELSETIAADYPRVAVMQIIASHEGDHTIYRNSNGTEFDTYDGCYEVTVEFTAMEGERSTGLSYTGFAVRSLDKPLIEQGGMRKKLADAEAALNVTGIDGKFEGRVILTPEVLSGFAYMIVANYLDSGVVMSGESMWMDRIGEKVAGDAFTLRLQADDDRLVRTSHYTDDGYAAENVTLIDRGVLKSLRLDLYASNKTGRPVTKNSGYGLLIEPGDMTLEDMITQTDRGLIVGGFSGGQPGANGEFSGVAKNSFYVENGRIIGAVNEVMISGNLAALVEKVIGLSDTLICDGMMAMPYMLTEGVVISGK